MVSRTFQFLFDVGGPNGYLVHRVLPDFCAAHGAVADYVPVLLGGLFKATGNRPPLMRYADAPAKWAYEQLEFDRFIAAHGLTQFRMNPHFPPNSLHAMRIIVGAAALGCQAEVIEAFMAGVWERGLDLGDRDAVTAHLDDAGVNSSALLARAEDPAVKAELTSNTEAAAARGAFGIPTFFVGEEMFFGKERLGQVAAALHAQ
jgi:2-hydroxychromene-2-carboxylate isomerase